jgi:hypothetical protein
MDTHTPKLNKRLFLLFLASSPFHSSQVRSLLKFFEEDPIFPLVEYNPNLYKASEFLTLDYRPIIYKWQLPNGSIEQVTINTINQADSNHFLVLDLGGLDAAKYLIGSNATPLTIEKLEKMVWAGLNVSWSCIGALTYEPSPNQEIQLAIVGDIYLSAAKMPIMLSSKNTLSPSLTCMGHEHPTLFFNNYLGSDDRVFVPEPLPLKLPDPEPNFSVWVDESENYYKLPNSLILPIGNQSLRNCFLSVSKSLAWERLKQYAINSEAAIDHLGIEFEQFFHSSIELINDWISNQATAANIEQTQKIDSIFSKTDWTKVLAECLELTESQLQQKPELLSQRLLELLIQFQNPIADENSLSPQAKNSATKMALKIQNVLYSHNIKIELQDLIEQLTDNVQQLNLIDGDTFKQSAEMAQLRKFISYLTSADLANVGLEKAIANIVDQYQQLGEDKYANTSDKKSEYTKSSQDIVRQVEAEYPLPSFSFEDLLLRDE